MQTFETAAVIRLIDHLSRPLEALAGKVAGVNNKFAAHAASIANSGRHLTYQMTLPILAAAKSAMDVVEEISKQDNFMKGVLAGRELAAKKHGETWEKTSDQIIAGFHAQARAAAHASKMMFGEVDYLKIAGAGTQAGLSEEGANALANNAFKLSRATQEKDVHKTAEDMLALTQAYGVTSYKFDENGRKVKRGFDEMDKVYTKFADSLAGIYQNAPVKYNSIMESLRLSAPLASQFGIDIGTDALVSSIMAEKGFKGGEAAVAKRDLYLKLMSPKSTAVPTMQNFGVDYFGAVNMRPGMDMSPKKLVEFLKNFAYGLSEDQATKAFAKAHADAKAKGLTGPNSWLGQLAPNITPLMTDKKGNLATPKVAADYLNKWLNMSTEGVDGGKLLLNMMEANLTPGALKNIFQGQQVPRLLSLFAKPQDGEPSVAQVVAEREFGPNWKQILASNTSGNGGTSAAGSAQRGMDEHSAGAEAAFIRIHNSWATLVKALDERADAFEPIIKAMNELALAADATAGLDTGKLKAIVTTLAALAALGPVMWMGGNVARLGAAFLALNPYIRTATVAVGLFALAMEKLPAFNAKVGEAFAVLEPFGERIAAKWSADFEKGFTTLHSNVEMVIDKLSSFFARIAKMMGWTLPGTDPTGGKPFKDAFKSELAGEAKDPITRAIAQRWGGEKPEDMKTWDFTKNGNQQTGSPVGPNGPLKMDVQGDVKGAVDLFQKVTFEPSPYFTALIEDMKKISIPIQGNVGKTMGGSNGVKSPVGGTGFTGINTQYGG